jgi:hypothetical protein
MTLLIFFILGGTIFGKVFDIDAQNPLQAHVYLKQTAQFNHCDSLGKFSLYHLPKGEVNLIVSHIGFKQETLSVEVPERGTVYLSIGLQSIPITIPPINVEQERLISIGTHQRMQEEIEIIPSAEKDVFKAIQTMPGVMTPSDYLGLLYVRGGELYENKVFIDRVEVLSPYHYFGFGSVFNSDLIETFEFYTGSFPARYGGAISSIVSMSSKTPEEKVEGTMSIDFIEANWLYLCTITDRLSFALSAKRNYLDLLLENLGIVQDVMLPYYLDYQAKILLESRLGTFSLSGLKSKEKTDINVSFADEKIKLDLEGNGETIALGWHNTFAEKVQCLVNLFYSQTKKELYVAMPGPTGIPESRREKSDAAKYGTTFHTQYIHEIVHLEMGGGYGKYRYMHDGPKIEDFFYGPEIFDYSFQIDTSDNYKYIYFSQQFNILRPFSCQIGERIAWFPLVEKPVFSPRLRLIYNKIPTVYLTYGHHHQLPPLEYRFDQPLTTYGKCITLGIKHLLKPTLMANVECYNKQYQNLVRKTNPDTSEFTLKNDGCGYASGVEISLRKFGIENHFGWVSYAFSISKKTSPYDSMPAITYTHRPHILNVVLGKKFKYGFKMGIKFLWASGTAYDKLLGKKWKDDKWIPVYGPEKEYLPAYQRLDTHIQKDFILFGIHGEVYLTILNVTNHRNIQTYIYNYDYAKRKPLLMIPRIPLLGLKCKF